MRSSPGHREQTFVSLVRAVAGVAVILAVAGSVILLAGGHVRVFLVESGASFSAPFSVFFAVLAWLVAPRQPRNAVIVVMAASALCFGLLVAGAGAFSVVFPGDPLVLYTSETLAPADLPNNAAWILTLTYLGWLPGLFLFITFGLLLFPDGRLPSSRWRWVAVLALVCVTAASIVGSWSLRPGSATPFNQELSEDSAATIIVLGCLLASVLSLTSLVPRFRRSRGETRQQIRWIVWGAAFFVAAVVPAFFIQETQYTAVGDFLFYLAGVVLLTSFGISVAKYRLYDINVVISRSVVFAILAAFITLTYALIVVGIGQRIGGDSGDLLLPIAATALVAAAFEPVRLRAQRWANRLVYGNRATPYEVLSELTARLSSAEEGDDLLQRLADLLRDGTGADEARVWVGEAGSMQVAATSPRDVSPAPQPGSGGETGFAVTHYGETVGALEVVKARGSVLSRQETSLVADLAGSAGAVLGHKRLNDSLAAKAIELEESRARLLGAQDQERRRLERELHEGAEQYIVALKVKLGVAAQLSAKQGATELTTLLEGLTAEAKSALDDVQSLAKGIYPPILESDGLGAAISALAHATPVDVHVERDGIGRYPADIEAAVYFDISEAVTNAVKHADPPIQIELSDEDGHLSFSVTDAGPGFDVDHSNPGSGMENMADRLAAVGGVFRVVSGPGRQTVVSGEIPVRQLTPR